MKTWQFIHLQEPSHSKDVAPLKDSFVMPSSVLNKNTTYKIMYNCLVGTASLMNITSTLQAYTNASFRIFSMDTDSVRNARNNF